MLESTGYVYGSRQRSSSSSSSGTRNHPDLPTIDGFQPSANVPLKGQFRLPTDDSNPLLRFRPFFDDIEELGGLFESFKDINTEIIRKIEPIGIELNKRKEAKG